MFRLGTSSKTSATADPNTIGNDNSITIETNGNEDSSIKTLQQFSNTALATVSINDTDSNDIRIFSYHVAAIIFLNKKMGHKTRQKL